MRAILVLAFHLIRSERLLRERFEFDLLFRGFVDLGINDGAWDYSPFSKNRDRLLEGEIVGKTAFSFADRPPCAVGAMIDRAIHTKKRSPEYVFNSRISTVICNTYLTAVYSSPL